MHVFIVNKHLHLPSRNRTINIPALNLVAKLHSSCQFFLIASMLRILSYVFLMNIYFVYVSGEE